MYVGVNDNAVGADDDTVLDVFGVGLGNLTLTLKLLDSLYANDGGCFSLITNREGGCF